MTCFLRLLYLCYPPCRDIVFGYLSVRLSIRLFGTLFVAFNAHYGQLKGCARRAGRPRLRYKDTPKHNLKTSKVNTNTSEAEATNRSAWRYLCRVAVCEFEKSRIAAAKEKRHSVSENRR